MRAFELTTEKSNYQSFNCDYEKPSFVFIKGMFTGFNAYCSYFERLVPHKCVILDPFACAKGLNTVSLDAVSEKVCDLLDQLKVNSSIVIGDGIGSLVSFKIAITRPDLVGAQLLIGISNKEMDSGLRSARIRALSYIIEK